MLAMARSAPKVVISVRSRVRGGEPPARQRARRQRRHDQRLQQRVDDRGQAQRRQHHRGGQPDERRIGDEHVQLVSPEQREPWRREDADRHHVRAAGGAPGVQPDQPRGQRHPGHHPEPVPAPPEQPERAPEDRDGAGHRAGHPACFGEDIGGNQLHETPRRLRGTVVSPYGCALTTVKPVMRHGGSVFRAARTDLSGCLHGYRSTVVQRG